MLTAPKLNSCQLVTFMLLECYTFNLMDEKIDHNYSIFRISTYVLGPLCQNRFHKLVWVFSRTASSCPFQPSYSSVNTLRPRQNGRHFADDPFKRIFLNETLRISIKISPNFVPKGPIDNIPALIQIMAWRRRGDKLLSGTMMFRLPTHICVTRPKWFNIHISVIIFNDIYK